MEEAAVTELWMLGVIGVMVVYAVAVFIGISKNGKPKADNQ